MRSFSPLLLLVSSLLLAALAQDECDLQCHSNATCVKGAADFSNHPLQPDGRPLDFHQATTSNKGYYCDCPLGTTGLTCGRSYYSCNDNRHTCYNGGACIEGLADMYGNDQLFCDCLSAVDRHGVEYIGKYCEIPKPVACGDASVEEAFCTNGG